LKFLLAAAAAAVAAAEVVDAEAEVSVAVVAACVPVADSRHRAACRVPLVQAWARGRVVVTAVDLGLAVARPPVPGQEVVRRVLHVPVPCLVEELVKAARGRVDYQEALEPARRSVPALVAPAILPADGRPLVNSAIS
jgi:hypothetical protein